MARKPAQTKADETAANADVDKPVPDATAPEADNTTGAPGTADHAGTGTAGDAPTHGATADAPILADDASKAALEQAVADLAGEDRPLFLPHRPTLIEPIASAAAPLPAAFIVTCHRQGGRRRAGRRWEHGATTVALGGLTAYELALLHGDPQFTVTAVDRD